MNINVITERGTATGVETKFNPDTGNHEATIGRGLSSIYVEVQLSEEQVSAADAYDLYVNSEYYTPENALHGFGIFLTEQYS